MPSAVEAVSTDLVVPDTIKKNRLFRNPPDKASAFPALQEAVRPHIDSWNAMTEEGGLLDLAMKDIGEKTVFDKVEQEPGSTGGFGNKLTCRYLRPHYILWVLALEKTKNNESGF